MILLFVIYVLLAIHFIMFHDLAPLVVVESVYCFDHALISSCNHAGNLFRLSTSNYLLTSVGKTLRIVIVYRPPPSTTNGLTTTIFFDEFSTFLEQYVTIPGSLLMVGDFNFHVDTCDSEYVTTFL